MTMSINLSSILWSEVFDAVARFLTAVAVAFFVPSNFALAGVFGAVGVVGVFGAVGVVGVFSAVGVIGSRVLGTLTAFPGVDDVLAVCSFEGDCLVDFL